MKQADNADIQESYRKAIRGILPTGAWVLCTLYLLYTISHIFVLSADVAKIMVPVAGLTSLFFFKAALWHEWAKRHSGSIFHRINPHLLLSIYCLVPIADVVIHISLANGAFQTTDLMIIQIGIASVVLNAPSFIALNAVILSSWAWIAQNNSHDRLWVHFGFALIATTTLSVIIFVFRRDSIRRLEAKVSAEMNRQKELIYSSKMAALGEMATGIAHEINNPLMIILGRASQLKEQIVSGKISDPEKIVADLDKIEATVMRISKIIKGLRSFARNTESDPKQNACVETIIDETVSFCMDRIQAQRVQYQINKFPKTEIYCRPAEISQVILNLLQNSLDAVEKLSAAQRWIRVQVTDTPEGVSIRIGDGGLGIPVEIQDKIMQPFFTTKQVGQGTGLGLSISRGIVEEHSGKLRYLASEKNTTFEVILQKASS